MLQVKEICKQYKTGDLVQTALDKVSLNFRDNEFVAILGPSGSGKTTLLNIIGGLDRYDSGDLIINNISTKKYKDRDWDSYRNHTIGFVFQSYYLIPHQTILSNVELALTISGITRAERRERAIKALQEVGLGDQIHKKPTQMSGGQMQRVAIARALVNNPDILLADEPTGALDTKTSVQVMDLLKEVAKDRLVVMVTHNPELAEEYATRIIKLKDGNIIGDTDPYEPESNGEEILEHQNMGKSSMTVGMAVSLSFNNLKTKIARTLLTSFAGSIGIIGIALILSLSTGVNNYINDIQRDTMTSYPITIQSQAMDLSQLFARGTDTESEDETQNKHDHELDAVYSDSMSLEMASSMAGSITENNLTLFKEYLDDENNEIHKYLNENGIVYSYDMTYDVYAYDSEGVFFNTNPYSGGQTINSAMGTYSMETNRNTNFSEMLPGIGDSLVSGEIMDNYDMVYGNWPTKYDEVVLVMNPRNEVDLGALYELGYLSNEEYNEMADNFVNMESFEFKDIVLQYDEVLNHSFYLMTASDMYEKEDDGLYTCFKDDIEKVEAHKDNGIELHIVGIIRPVDRDSASIYSTIAYTNALTQYMMTHTQESGVVCDQMADPDTNVLNGFSFTVASDEEKITAAKEYLTGLTNNEKVELFMGILEQYSGGSEDVRSQYAAMSEQDIADMFDASLAQLDNETLIGFYDEYIAGGSYDANMTSFGYVDENCPSSISLYTNSFENKDNIAQCIKEYNDSHSEEDKITYTDYIGLLLSSVTKIINIISYVLIAFVAVSLIVSSIMIGIITYISVLERTKEIGILRAIGASKKNISLVFNAETFIIGLCSGLMGVFVSWLLLFPANALIHYIGDTNNVNAVLPLGAAVILVVLSTVLTLIGGLIPSRKAAKMDPVAALRTE
ncbi:MAG: ABC transporter ATP-binding protein/permease [Clostridia bacterium]|nr:ABC transporter ATP-binding protein/permease [Clostridia bacterium]